jgi:hypothetical protein
MTSTNVTDDDLIRRAFASWFRTGGIDQPSNASGLVEHDGKQYVVLRNTTGPLAIYRITNQGSLKRLRRWPDALDA